MHSAVPDHRHQKSSPRGKIKRPQHEVGDILRRLKSDVTISKLSDEEDIHFWEMMNEDDDQSPCQEAVDFSPGSSGTSTEYGGAIVKAKTDSNEQNDDNATQSLGEFFFLFKPGVVTNSVIFSQLYTIKDHCKKRFVSVVFSVPLDKKRTAKSLPHSIVTSRPVP